MIDLQSHGESTGHGITFGWLESRDVRAAVAFAKRRLSPLSHIGLVGISLGGASALLGPAPIEVDALVLESVYSDIRVATDNRIRRWLGPISSILTPVFMQEMKLRLGVSEEDLRPLAHIADFHHPLLILSGSADQHARPEEARALFDQANEPKKIEMFEGAGHVDLYDHDPAKYERLVTAFFAEALGR